MKKAQGISINAIIIAAIALIVLVVLIAIFTGRMTIFSKDLTEQRSGTQKCTDIGDWISPSDCEDAGRTAIYTPLSDSAEGSEGGTKVCCLKAGSDDP